MFFFFFGGGFTFFRYPAINTIYSAFTLTWLMSFLKTLIFHCFRWLKEKNSTSKSLTINQVRVNGLYNPVFVEERFNSDLTHCKPSHIDSTSLNLIVSYFSFYPYCQIISRQVTETVVKLSESTIFH